MPKIFNIRGTSGSGKSTIVYTLMGTDPDTQPHLDETGKIIGHLFAYNGQPFAAVGKYTTPCGGCDAVPTQDEIGRRVRLFHEMGRHVIFEGLLVSGIYGRYKALSEEFPGDYYWVTLNTSLEECLRRVGERRAARGMTTPLNPVNTTDKHKSIVRDTDKAEREGIWVIRINDVEDFKRLLGEVL